MSKQITLALVMLAAIAGNVRAQSLADVAKKEEERRKASPPPAKIYTNKDLVEVAGAPAPPPPATPSDSAAVVDKEISDLTKGDAKEPAKDQAYWAGRLKKLQDALDRDTSYSSALQSQINALTTDFVNRDDPAQRAIIEKNRIKALADLNQLKTTILSDQKAITDFQEEARRAGVPPGWLR
jgi:hypothetical protein